MDPTVVFSFLTESRLVRLLLLLARFFPPSVDFILGVADLVKSYRPGTLANVFNPGFLLDIRKKTQGKKTSKLKEKLKT